MGRSRRHLLIVEIETLDAQGSRESEDRLIRWLGHFGHTAPSFGFKFFSAGRVAAKPMNGKMLDDEDSKP